MVNEKEVEIKKQIIGQLHYIQSSAESKIKVIEDMGVSLKVIKGMAKNILDLVGKLN